MEAAAGLLEGSYAEAELARSVLEVEVEKALEYLVVDADVAQRSKFRILFFRGARKEPNRSPPFWHVWRSRSAVVHQVEVEERSGREPGDASDTRAGDRSLSNSDLWSEKRAGRQAA